MSDNLKAWKWKISFKRVRPLLLMSGNLKAWKWLCCYASVFLELRSAVLWCLGLDSIFFSLVKAAWWTAWNVASSFFDYGDLKSGLWNILSLSTSLPYFLQVMKTKCHWCIRILQSFWFISYLLGSNFKLNSM